MNTDNKTAIVPFLFGESAIRTTTHQGTPWFVIADVCRTLEIANAHNIPKRLHPDDLHTMEVIDSMGRTQTVNICNESGIYTLIFQSRKPAAKEFTRWVTSVVLPTIRRTGSFHRGHQAYLYLIADQIALGVSADLAARMAGKLTNIPKEELPGYAPAEFVAQEISALVSVMKPGVVYAVGEIGDELPKGHPLANGTAAARCARLGKLMEKARALGYVQRVPHNRRSLYRLSAEN